MRDNTSRPTTTRIMVVGDLHYDFNPYFLKQGEHDKHISTIIREIAEKAKASRCNAVVFVGDVFDNAHPSQVAQEALAAIIAMLVSLYPDIEWLFLPGNHDTHSEQIHSMLWLRAMSGPGNVLHNIRVVDKAERVPINGLPVITLPWYEQHNEAKAAEIATVLQGRPTLVFAHNEVRGAQMDNGWIADGLDLADTAHTWVIGHLHTPQSLHNGKVTYVGTPTVRHPNHTPRGALLLTVKHQGSRLLKVDMQDVPLVQPYWFVEGPPPRRYRDDTYYKIHLEAGVPVPDNPRIVRVKRLGQDTTKPQKDKTVRRSAERDLLNPTDWFVGNLRPEIQDRVKGLLSRALIDNTDS